MRQTLRMIDNVRVLLETDSFDWDDVGQMLVYLRDPADYGVEAIFLRSGSVVLLS